MWLFCFRIFLPTSLLSSQKMRTVDAKQMDSHTPVRADTTPTAEFRQPFVATFSTTCNNYVLSPLALSLYCTGRILSSAWKMPKVSQTCYESDLDTLLTWADSLWWKLVPTGRMYSENIYLNLTRWDYSNLYVGTSVSHKYNIGNGLWMSYFFNLDFYFVFYGK